ncbi:uncharacterized protein LOC118767104 [Octopus sinensis]|uniref:Uncharacterized protein LOC118767104 n=1 Tax=Octopus sinensis TaxID=2607531 RepID=A0A7E6FI62_9MOLL|nr:uncharacterized protein LOC118767104 [Octopus sinensis]
MNNFHSCNCLQNNTNNSKTSSTTVNSNNSNFQRLSSAENHVCCQSQSLQPSLHQTLPELDFERGLWNDAVTGDIEGVRRKLEKQRYGCTANATDTSGYTPLAAVRSDADIISLLLHRYPQLHNITDNNGFLAKHYLPEDKSTQLFDLFP